MSIKRKMRRHQKVVSIETKRVLVSNIDIHRMVEETDIHLDELFSNQILLSLRGVMLPVIYGDKEGEGIPVFRLARDLNETRILRKELFENTELDEDDWDEVKEIVDDLFCTLLDLTAKGVIGPAIYKEKDGSERPVIRLARDIDEARLFRKTIFENTELSEDEWDELKENLDDLMPDKRILKVFDPERLIEG